MLEKIIKAIKWLNKERRKKLLIYEINNKYNKLKRPSYDMKDWIEYLELQQKYQDLTGRRYYCYWESLSKR